MMATPRIYTANRSGLPLTPVEIAAFVIVSVIGFVLQDLTVFAVAMSLLAVFVYLAQWGSKPTLKCIGDSLEYRNGKILISVKRSDISRAAIRGGWFLGRSLVISGNATVTLDGGKPVRRTSLRIPDSFPESLEDIQKAILSG